MTRSYTLGNWDGSLSASDATKQRPTSGEMNLSDSVIVHFASSQNSPLQSVPATCGDKEESSTVFHMGDSEKKGEPEELKVSTYLTFFLSRLNDDEESVHQYAGETLYSQ